MAEEPMLLTAQQVSERTGIGVTKVGDMIRKGELPSISIGRLRRVPTRLLEKWIEDQIEGQGQNGRSN